MAAKKKESVGERELDLVEIRIVAIHDSEGKLSPHGPTSAAIEAVNALKDTFVLYNVTATTPTTIELPSRLGENK